MNRKRIKSLATFSGVVTLIVMANTCSAQLDVRNLTTTDVADGYRTGAFTAVELTQAYLDRIDAYERKYNAFTYLNPNALEVAARLDQEYAAQGPRGPLHGVPIVIKDAIDIAGVPTTNGAAELTSQRGGFDLIPPTDATVVERLENVGAIVLGKTNLPAWSDGATRADTSWDGPTYNAHDRLLAPGASSSGTATATSAGFAVFGLGTENAGSIQNPAAAQNLVGITPTFGLVPTSGIMPSAASTRDVVGPIAKTVFDAAIALDAIAGNASDEPRTSVSVGQIPDGGYTSELSESALNGKRIGLYGTGWQRARLRGEAEMLYEQAKSVLVAKGAELVEDPFGGSGFSDLEMLPFANDPRGFESIVFDMEKYLERARPTSDSNSLVEFRDVVGIDLFGPGGVYDGYLDFFPVANQSWQDPDVAPDFAEFAATRAEFRSIFDGVFEAHNLDALVFPQSLRPIPFQEGTGTIDATTVDEINILGTPGVTVPAGYYENGSPFSLIFMGPAFSEAEILSLAFDYEQATLHWNAPDLFLPTLLDANDDDVVNVDDLDLTCRFLAGDPPIVKSDLYDFDEDGVIDSNDVRYFLIEFGSVPGDTDLDRIVDFTDFTTLSTRFGKAGRYWSRGDFNCDGTVGFADFLTLSSNFNDVAVVTTVPEPSGLTILLITLGGGFLIRRAKV